MPKNSVVKKMRIIFLLLLIGVFSPLKAEKTNKYVLTELPTQQQLPVANVHCILQDREGFIWYGTRGGGLCRDNGYHIDVFRSDHNHPDLIGKSNDITSIAEDFDNQILFSTQEGLYVLNKHDYKIRSADNRLTGTYVGPILVASDSTVWVCSQRQIYHYDKRLHLIETHPSLWRGERIYASRMMEDSHHQIWVTQWGGGVIRYNPNSHRFEEQYWEEGIIPADLVEDPSHQFFWIGTWGMGIMRYAPKNKTLTPQPCSYGKGNTSLIIHLTKDASSHRLWASTMYGLYCYDITDNQLTSVDLSYILPKGLSVIDNLTIDSKGNLWVSGFSPHTFILSKPDISIHKESFDHIREQLHNRPFIWNSTSDGENLWLGQDRSPLALYQPQKNAILFDKDNSNIARLGVDKFQKCRRRPGIWDFKENQLYHVWFDGKGIKSEAVAMVRDEIYCIYDAGDGNVYIGHKEGIDKYDEGSKCTNSLPVHSKGMRYILKAKNGILYYSSDNNPLAYYDAKHGEHVISRTGEYTALAEDKGGRIWASSKTGDLICYDPVKDTLTTDDKGSTPNGEGIKSIAIDDKGHIWILSDQMLKEYNPQAGAYRIFRTSDRDIQMDCFHHVKSEGNRVCIDGAGGILYITPSVNIDQLSSTAKPIITSISIDGNRHIIGMDTRSIDIEHDAVNIEIQFSTLNYLNADKVSYAYRLDGIDDQWHYLPQGVNKATFVKLPKGEYTFELMATDEYGCWGEKTKVLTLNREPAWYESWWAYILYTLTGAAILMFAINYFLSRQKEKQQHKMDVQLTEMKLRFFTNISHELRTPLTLILTPIENILKKIRQWEQDGTEDNRIVTVNNQLILIEKNAQRLLSLVNRLLDFRKLEMGQQKLELTNGNIYDFVRTVCETFRPLSTEKGIGLGCAIPNIQLYINFDSNKLQHIMYNLLSNAFKFTASGGQITVSVSEPECNLISITVKDSGCGIPSRDLPHIFDRYYQSKNAAGSSVTGTGIGLHLTQEFVKLHGGSISVTSKLGEGSTFTVMIPTNLKIQNTKIEAATTETVQENQEAEQAKSNILIVDDNDEFRQFLADELSEQYHIVQAANGEEAYKIVTEQDIDLVVSDLMMPVMDGMELCRRIKKDISTSHIMVILLTARAAEETQLEGFKAGADDYLSKPFNMEMLQLRISHLQNLRQKRNQEFMKSEEVKIEEVALNDMDKKFFQTAVDAVEKNISNEQYDIDALAADVFMSRSTLYRKIRSLTGQKPSVFIRAIRLKRAARLLKEGQYSVTEVSSMCGFASLSYFSRCFKAQYGTQPGNYK